ncbi:adenylosuccinate synthase [Leadbetterella byssophila]|uniref:Adenylosuccinate synthetase n=1 Tax=Leadbetterella byssophila (strain DSM 17132 / JCM 16389 / KACC 11308 / NBRC 106382 / 4M15) TaxID=649349 RepID=E4RSM2_LEAB4|nr:adenylosuccinate synthase [Leadbetterella byssophila]ADQ18592.1 adenylosuccinate synthetase [Leadbetterella byssophila DSM 17132]
MVDILLGLQWGDEGKGKIVDVLAPQYKVVARFQGGPNAGHTLEFEGKKHVLHQIPSGIFRPESINIIGNGVVLDPIIFKKEIEALAPYQIDFSKTLYISKKTAIIIPTHRLLDAASEKAKAEAKIGSTLKGIGPTYADKISRQGLRLGDALSEGFQAKYNKLVETHKRMLDFYQFEYDLEAAEKEFFEALEFIKKFNLVESEYLINKKLAEEGTRVLAEGAQGSLLDIDFGSYPFVTSSNTTASGVCSGLGVSPSKIAEVYGIFKAYCTRVGSGPFPTELLDETGERMRQEGREFGSTTGRPRRCGWIDLPTLKYSIMLNGVTQLVMMKVDVLNIFDEIKVCTHYELPDGTITDELPYDMTDITLKPVYKTLPGWKQSLEGIQDFEQMPQALKDYTAFLEKELNTAITYVSTGPDRSATLSRKSLL